MPRSFDVLAGRGLGMLVFLAGIGALVFAFVMSYRMFTSPVAIGDSANSAAGASAAIIALITRVALLFVMVLVGSLVAARGVQMYAAIHPHPPAGPPPPSPPEEAKQTDEA